MRPEEIQTRPDYLNIVRHLPELTYGGLKYKFFGDRRVIIDAIGSLLRRNEYGITSLKNLPGLSQSIHIFHSLESLQALGSNNSIDKPDILGALITGDEKGKEFVMGPGKSEDYQEQLTLAEPFIERKKTRLKTTVGLLAPEHFKLFHSPSDLRQLELSANAFKMHATKLILYDIFPAHDWSDEEVVYLLAETDKNIEVFGEGYQNGILKGQSVTEIEKNKAIKERQAAHMEFYRSLYVEEQEHIGVDADQLGLLSVFTRNGVLESSAIAATTNFFTASAETIANSMHEFAYQTARNPNIWNELQQLKQNDTATYRRKLRNAIYESVRIINPLPILLREATADTVINTIHLKKGDIAIAFLPGVLMDKQLFPNPQYMRPDLELSEEQIATIHVAWGLESQNDTTIDRFCKGYAYSIAAITGTIEYLLDNYEAPKLLSRFGNEIRMSGTQGRKSRVSLLRIT